MFLPDASSLNEKKIADDRRREAFRNIEKWGLELIPEDIREAAVISAQEIQCSDPDCAPIDTTVNVVFDSGMDGMFALPCEAYEVTKEELKVKFPTRDVLEKWHQGIDEEWPPIELDLPQLRFTVGTKVMCRTGPNPEKDWLSGTITQLWYKEKSWPEGSFAPYKVKLDDGRQIFAPGDMDQVIRRLEE